MVIVPCYFSVNAACIDGPVRVVDYDFNYNYDDYVLRGRIEVCYNGTYYPLCEEGWTGDDAAVMCKYWGYYPPYFRKYS